MSDVTTLETLAKLEREMAAGGRDNEVKALQEAVACLSRSLTRGGEGLLTTGEAAEKLGVSISTVKRWVQRGVLRGVDTGTRWLVGREGVERILRMRKALAELDEQGYPTAEEFAAIRRRGRRARGEDVA
jgi:excisionase family DNA binding protein